MCLGGHLAYRAAFDKRVAATVCYFATDIHSHSLGEGKNDDSLKKAKNIEGELVMVYTMTQWTIMITILTQLARSSARRIRMYLRLVVI
jgi:dienelactone hydrolase